MTIQFINPPVGAKRTVERHLTIAQLRHSRHNCRTEPPSAEDTAALEALILDQKLRVPIEVHELDDEPGAFGVFAGRRRFYSIARLVERGDVPADWLIPCKEYVGYDAAELIELSLSENFRQDLKDHELAAGMARAHAEGHDVEEIARNLGNLEAVLVARWVAVGSLHADVFAALASGEIDLDRAKAYAATEDRALQLEVFERMRQAPQLRREAAWHAHPTEIRRAFKFGHVELERRLAFVGADTYRAAGGRYEADLFAEQGQHRGRVVDEPVLSELVANKLDEIRVRTRLDLARPDLRFIGDRPKSGYGGYDATLEHRPKQVDGESPKLPDGVVGYIAIADDGTHEVTYWWETAAAKAGGGRATSKPRAADRILGRPAEGAALSTSEMSGGGEARRQANAALRDEGGLTADLIEILRSQRRLILRAALVDVARGDRAPIVAAPGDEYLVYAQLRMLLGDDRIATTGVGYLQGYSPDPVVTAEHLQAMPADRIWRDALVELQQAAFLQEADIAAGYQLYRAADPALRALAGAVVTAVGLERAIDADGYRIAGQDALATELGLTDDRVLRRFWTPTAALLARLPKDQRAAIAEPFVEKAAFAPWPRLKDAQLTDNVLQVVTGEHPATRTTMRAAAATWVHPQLRFRDVGGHATRYLSATLPPITTDASAAIEPKAVS